MATAASATHFMKTSHTMKISFAALAIASVLAFCSGQQIPAEILSAALAPRGPAPPRMSLHAVRGSASLCQGSPRSCTSCRRYAECAFLGGELELLHEASCPDLAPFCDPSQGGLCVSRPPAQQGCELPVPAEDFTCYAGEHNQGYFPAPRDYGKYYVCAPGRRAYVYVCPAGLSYDHSAAGCTSRLPCSGSPLSCASKARSYVLYGQDPSVYAYCTDNSTALVSKCFPGYAINVANPGQGCKPYCSPSVAGRIRNVQDPRGYFECFGFGKPIEQWCPTGMEFDDSAKRCATPVAVIPSTTQPPPTTAPPANPTTVPGKETTAPPVNPTTAPPANPTTAPGKETTAPPVNPTTAPPANPTTAPGKETTALPVNPTTAPPANPTTAPVETTAPPVNPTTAPVETTAPPVNPTTAPVETTAPPANPTTALPINPTMKEPCQPNSPIDC